MNDKQYSEASFNENSNQQYIIKTTNSTHPKKVIDTYSAILLILGIVSGIVAFKLTQSTELNILILTPSVVATTTGALNLTTIKRPR